MSYIVEPEKRVPVAYEVDVAVAGGGDCYHRFILLPDDYLTNEFHQVMKNSPGIHAPIE
jgi:hypothetical protein